MLLVAILSLAGCQSDPALPDTPPSASSSVPVTTRASKVLVVIEENHTEEQMRAGMPYLAALATTYGRATQWTAITHPSLPNYLAIAGGSTFGITDDRAPAAHAEDVGASPSVFDLALAAGKTAGTYAESMPENCHVYDFPDRADGVPEYAVRHNPWVYFEAGREGCSAHDTDTTSFLEDSRANALPNVGFLIPNLVHDAHDGSLGEADDWLRSHLSPVLASDDFTSGRLVVIITADEDDRSADNRVLTAVLTPALSGKVVDVALTHYSLTRYLCQVLGVAPIGEAADAPDLKDAFGL